MNLTKAAKILDDVRNDRTSTVQELSRRVDEVGYWLAGQKHSKKVTLLLSECQELHWSLRGEPTHHGLRVAIG